MAVTVQASNTLTSTAGGTEDSLASVAVTGVFTLSVDTVNMAAGDVIELRVYQIVLTGGTKRVALFATYAGAQPTDDVMKVSVPMVNDLTDTNSLQFTLKQTFGSARNFPWKILKVA